MSRSGTRVFFRFRFLHMIKQMRRVVKHTARRRDFEGIYTLRYLSITSAETTYITAE